MKRSFIAAILVALSLSIAGIASATSTSPNPAPDMNGRPTGMFTVGCTAMGGRILTDADGHISCVYKNGSKVTCRIEDGRTTDCKRFSQFLLPKTSDQSPATGPTEVIRG